MGVLPKLGIDCPSDAVSRHIGPHILKWLQRSCSCGGDAMPTYLLKGRRLRGRDDTVTYDVGKNRWL